MLALLVPGVGMGGSDEPAVIATPVESGRHGVRRPVSIYCLVPALLVLLEHLRG